MTGLRGRSVSRRSTTFSSKGLRATECEWSLAIHLSFSGCLGVEIHAYKHYPANHTRPSSSGLYEPGFWPGFILARAFIHSYCLFNRCFKAREEHVSRNKSNCKSDEGRSADPRRFKKRGAGERGLASGVAVGSAKGMLSGCKS